MGEREGIFDLVLNNLACVVSHFAKLLFSGHLKDVKLRLMS